MSMEKVKNPHAVAMGKLGGKASAKALTKEERKLRASNAAKALWKKIKEVYSNENPTH